MSNPLVSVLLTTYNQPQALAEALESLANQSFKDFEIVLVNDAGASVAAVVKAYPDLAIHLLESTVNRGQTASLNLAVSLARGEFFMLLDHDDMLERQHLGLMVEALQQGADLAFADAEIFEHTWQDGVRIPTRRSLLAHHFDRAMLRNFLTFTPSGTLYRRTIHDTIGLFDTQLAWCYWDWDFILRVSSAHFQIQRVPVASVYYAFSTLNGSADHTRMRPLLEHLMAKHALAALKTTNFALMTDDPELDAVRATSLRVWDGRPLVSRLAGELLISA